MSSDGTHPNFRMIDDSEYAEDFGSYTSSPWDLTEDEERYRAAAYAFALHYARDYHLAVLPVWWVKDEQTCACPLGAWCESIAKHPCDLRWPEVASDDPEHAARWWRPPEPDQTLPCDWRPRANVAVAMRRKRLITDIDVGEGKRGEESLARLIAEHGGEEMPPTLEWQTGGGGRQRITLAPEGVDVRNSASKIAPDIDIRGFNGYGLAPPSRSAKGEYLMLLDISPDVPTPAWEADWLREQHRRRTEHIASHPAGDVRQIPADGLTKRAHGYITAAFKNAVDKVAAAEERTRNVTLNEETFDLLSKFVPAGLLSFDDVAAAMQDAGEACGLSSSAVYKTIESAWRGSQRKDRSSELPDFLFEVPSAEEDEDRPRLPSLAACIYEFERTYTLRRTDGGEFVSRPSDPEVPALVSDIGAEMGWRMRQWWRDRAEVWEEHIARLTAQAAADPDQDQGDGNDAERANTFPNDATFTNALSHLRASAARHDPVAMYTRIMDAPDRIVVDLCDSESRVVEITAGGWRVCDIREVAGEPWFRRSGSMLAQVVPVAPDDVVSTLKAAQLVLGLDDEAWALALGALIGWHFPGIDRPGEWLTGPSGSGKSTRGHMLVNLVDPVKKLGGRVDVRRDERNARTRAMARYVMTTDNITEVSPELSDWWCTLHTGVADEVRKLHSDNELLSYDYQRVGLATSLVLPAGLQPDALRRTLHIDLDASGVHPDKTALWQAYEKIRPRLLGAIYTVLSEVLKKLPDVLAMALPGCPEMSDYARRLKAADLAFGPLVLASHPGGEDLKLYEAYSTHTGDIQLQRGADDPLAQLVIEVMSKHRDAKGQLTDFDDTPTALYKLVKKTAESHVMSENYVLSKKWPSDPTKLGTELTKLYKPLLELGFEFTRGRSKKARSFKITRVPVPAHVAGAGGDARPASGDAGIPPGDAPLKSSVT